MEAGKGLCSLKWEKKKKGDYVKRFTNIKSPV